MPRSTEEGGEHTREDPVEGRGHRSTEPLGGTRAGPPGPGTLSTKLQRIAKLVEQADGRAFNSLAHFIDMDWMREAYRRTRKDGATGIDGQTAEEYSQNLEGNLLDLLDRAKSGAYRAPPVRRVHIPKGDGKTRPIGIPTFEDKVLQRAVGMLLEAVLEPEFREVSYGFRPGRSAHQAVESLWTQTMRMGGGWVIDADIQGFFDTLDHAHLVEMLRQRVQDGVLLRLIGKWLKAGVMEAGQVTHPEEGTPQGGVISPILANLYLHDVLDVWFEREVRPRLSGEAFLLRYADDFVIVCAQEEDARRVLDVLPKRFERYGLTLHPTKTRLVPFRRPRRGDDEGPGSGTFDLLGFTHFWARSRKGTWVVKRKTAKSRFTRALRRVAEWCRDNRHRPIAEQREKLSQKLRGHCGYYGITGNSRALSNFSYELVKAWWKWLNRRTQQARVTWEAFLARLLRDPLPGALAIHSVLRMAAKP